MKLNDLSESSTIKKKRVLNSKRSNRLTMAHLLKMRRIREKKKLEKIKDMKLYQIMYSSDDNVGM